jgi:hypothetical protein
VGSGTGAGMGYGAGSGLGAGTGGPLTFIRPAGSTPNFVSSNNTSVLPIFTPPPSTGSPAPAFVPPAPGLNAAEDRAAQIQQRLVAAKAIAEKIAAIKGPSAEEEVKAVVREVEEVKDTTGLSGEDVVAMLAKEVEANTGSTE